MPAALSRSRLSTKATYAIRAVKAKILKCLPAVKGSNTDLLKLQYLCSSATMEPLGIFLHHVIATPRPTAIARANLEAVLAAARATDRVKCAFTYQE